MIMCYLCPGQGQGRREGQTGLVKLTKYRDSHALPVKRERPGPPSFIQSISRTRTGVACKDEGGRARTEE